MSASPFPRLVSEAMARRGLGLRELCRRAGLDPSFFSKVLAGKRNPPAEEDALRRLARALGADPVELIVAAGRVPAEWGRIAADPELLRRVHSLAVGGRASASSPMARSAADPTACGGGPPSDEFGSGISSPYGSVTLPGNRARSAAGRSLPSPKPFSEELL